MSLSPMAPNLSNSVKGFWKRPEGKAGMVTLGLIAAGALYGWSQITGWIIGMLTDTIHIGILVGVLIGGFVVLTNWRTRMLFRLAMRALMGIFINLDPIDILKDHLSEMKKKRDVMNEQIGNVRGSKQKLQDIITKNTQDIDQNMKLAQEAQRRSSTATSSDEQLKWALQIKLHGSQAERLKNANVNYAQLLTKITTLYDLLTKWSTNVDYFIADTTDTIQQAIVQSKTINSAYSAFSKAMAIFKGNGGEDEVYDSAMEHLADEASMKLGQMEDFQRVAANFMDNIDLQNGVVNNSALEALDKYEQKALGPGSDTTFLLPASTVSDRQPVPVPAKSSGGSDYGDFFKK